MNHAEIHNYRIIYSSTYTHTKPNCTLSNIANKCLFSIQLQHYGRTIVKPLTCGSFVQNSIQHEMSEFISTDWLECLCKKTHKTQNEPQLHEAPDIDDKINNLTQQIQKFFHDATHRAKNHSECSPEDPTFPSLMKQKNKHRRKFQKINNPVHKLHRNLLSNLFRKHIIESINQKWQDTLSNVRKMDHTQCGKCINS